MPSIADHIGLRPAENLIQATGYASQIGLPLNQFVTIAWQQADFVGRIHDVQGLLLQRMRKWLLYRGVTPAFVWVLEVGETIGLHGHYLVHVPDQHITAFEKMLSGWIDGDVTRGVVVVEKVTNVRPLLRYLLKGLRPRSAALLRIEPRPQGNIAGKRLGTSQNLGPKARRLGNHTA